MSKDERDDIYIRIRRRMDRPGYAIPSKKGFKRDKVRDRDIIEEGLEELNMEDK